jgi:hypothetical protein
LPIAESAGVEIRISGASGGRVLKKLEPEPLWVMSRGDDANNNWHRPRKPVNEVRGNILHMIEKALGEEWSTLGGQR